MGWKGLGLMWCGPWSTIINYGANAPSPELCEGILLTKLYLGGFSPLFCGETAAVQCQNAVGRIGVLNGNIKK